MKKYVLIASIAGFVASCTNDSAEEFLPPNKKTTISNFSSMNKALDTLDTGGQGGSTPIKPPQP